MLIYRPFLEDSLPLKNSYHNAGVNYKDSSLPVGRQGDQAIEDSSRK
jgi:hypothetical protein